MADEQATEAAERERNLELLRRGTEAYNAGDLSFVTELAADDIEVHADPGLINTGDYRGKDEFLRWMQNWSEAWSEVTLEVRSVETADDRFMLVEVFQTGVGSASGVPVEMGLVQLFEIGGGEIKRFHLYPDRTAATATLERWRAGDPGA
jgi:ketosteroid isomerase-like protein